MFQDLKYVWSWIQWWLKQEILEVADQGLHCLAWQDNTEEVITERAECKNTSENILGAEITRDLEIQNIHGNSDQKHHGNSNLVETDREFELSQTSTVEEQVADPEVLGEDPELGDNNSDSDLEVFEEGCNEDIFLDSELQEEQILTAKLEGLAVEGREKDRYKHNNDEGYKFFVLQPSDDQGKFHNIHKFFAVQPFQCKENNYDQVTDLQKDQDLNDVEGEQDNSGGVDEKDADVGDLFKDIEIEDLEAEKGNVSGTMTEVEKLTCTDANSPLSKMHYQCDHKKSQYATKLDSCLDSYEEIII